MSPERSQSISDNQRKEHALAPAKAELSDFLKTDFVTRREVVKRVAVRSKIQNRMSQLKTEGVDENDERFRDLLKLHEKITPTPDQAVQKEGENIFDSYKEQIEIAKPGIDPLQRDWEAAEAILVHISLARVN